MNVLFPQKKAIKVDYKVKGKEEKESVSLIAKLQVLPEEGDKLANWWKKMMFFEREAELYSK